MPECAAAKRIFQRLTAAGQQLRLVWLAGAAAHWARRPALLDWLTEHCRCWLTIVLRSDDKKGLIGLPRRWVVERTFAWLKQQRRLAKDYQRLPAARQAFIHLAMIRLRLRRLAPASPL